MTHFPVVPEWLGNPREVHEETWRQLEMLYDEGEVDARQQPALLAIIRNKLFSGRIRALGVSNYSENDLTQLLDYCSIKPHVNQCEFHPWYNPVGLRSFCAENDILYTVRIWFDQSEDFRLRSYVERSFQGYCPIAKGKFLDADVLLKLSAKYNKTPAQICLRWSLEHGVPVIPKSKEKSRIAENMNVRLSSTTSPPAIHA